MNFNPRAPCGARQESVAMSRDKAIFQSTRPVRGATLPPVVAGDGTAISIHAPRAGRDQGFKEARDGKSRISIHAPRAGRDMFCDGKSNQPS